MADKGWTAQTATAAGVAAGTGAAQLGLGYGLGVVVWPTSATTGDTVWLSSLGWAAWIAAGSTVFGAVAGSRAATLGPSRIGPLRGLTLVAAAAVGALLTVVLIAVPARAAVRADTFSPQTTAAGYAVAGILLGTVIAYWAVASRPVAANVILTAVWLWGLAIAAITNSLVTHVTLSGVHLGGWQPGLSGSEFRFGVVQWPSALLMLGSALLVGVLAVWPAVRRGDHGLGAATSGAVGPLLVALTFLILVPRVTTALGELETAYLAAPYAVLSGLAGSALMVALARQAALRRSGRAPDPRSAAPTAVPAVVARPAGRPAAPPASPPVGRAPRTGAPDDEEPPASRGLLDRLRGRRRPSGDDGDPGSPPAVAPRQGRPGPTPSGPAASGPAASGPAASGPAASGPAASGPAAGSAPGPAAQRSPEPRPGTVAPPPQTPTVATINPPQAPTGADTETGRARGAARPARSTGRAAEPTAARKPARPRRSGTGATDPADDSE